MARNIEIVTTHQDYPDAFIVLNTVQTTIVNEVFNSADAAQGELVSERRAEMARRIGAGAAGTFAILVGGSFIPRLIEALAEGDLKKGYFAGAAALVCAVAGEIGIFNAGQRSGEGRDEIIADRLKYVRDLIMPTEEAIEAEPQKTPFL